MTKSLPSCRDCRYLVRFKKEGDIFWHYRCENFPNSQTFDTWKSLTCGRVEKQCGYKKKEDDDKVRTPWDNNGSLNKYPFKKGYWNKL